MLRSLFLIALYCLPFAGYSQIDTTYSPPTVSNIQHFDPLKYPLKAIRKKIEGAVKVEIQVDSLGAYVEHNTVSSPGEVLTEAVTPFISGLTFSPAQKGKQAVAGVAEITIIFRIERRVPIRTEITFRFERPKG